MRPASDIRSVQWLEPDGELRGTADISADGSHASLWDMYLVPGEHWIGVETEGDDYTLAMTPLGPLAEGSERESNDDGNNAEPIELDEPRTGRLPGPADSDVYRFSLEAAEHVVLRLDPPADGGVMVKLLADGTELMRLREPAPGQPLVYDAYLPIGDYELTLRSDSGSVSPYRLLVARGDPYLLPVDLEPNDVPRAARDLPPTLQVQARGWGAAGEDDDWYRLAPPPDPSLPLVVTTTGPVTRMELTDGVSGVGIDADETGAMWTSRALPSGVATVPPRHQRRRLHPGRGWRGTRARGSTTGAAGRRVIHDRSHGCRRLRALRTASRWHPQPHQHGQRTTQPGARRGHQRYRMDRGTRPGCCRSPRRRDRGCAAVRCHPARRVRRCLDSDHDPSHDR